MNFRSEIHIVASGRRYLGISIMGILVANLNQGAKFTIIAEGPDAEIAVETLELLLAHFAEEEDLQKEVSLDRKERNREAPDF
jgi:phosphotransferase system HPr-like phosphotransfer protein